MWRCEKCGNFSFDDTQICKCKAFTVTGEDGETCIIRALDEEGAALKYAEEVNVEGDYYLMDDTEDILVGGKAFRVGAEPDVNYFVSAI